MTDRNSDDPASKTLAARREQEVRANVESLFRRCESGKNPVLSFSRACSKVGYLARDGVRRELHYLESALNERKHALAMDRLGHPDKAKEHNRHCGEDLRSFQRAIRVELNHPREPLSTPDLQGRIHRNLGVGQWSRARSDLDELSKRPNLDKQLPELGKYSYSYNLDEQQFAAIQGRIERCNALVLERTRSIGAERGPLEPGTPHGAALRSPSRAPGASDPVPSLSRSPAVQYVAPGLQVSPCVESQPAPVKVRR